MKKKILLSTILASALLTTVPVEAQGTANVSLISENKVQVGDTFKVSLQVSDIQDTYDGVVSMSGRLSFDEEKLEFISGKAMEEPYQFQMNTNTMMIAGLDFTLKNGFYTKTEVYEFTFKALEEGNSNITLQKATLTDSKGYITTEVISKDIEVVKAVEEKKEIEMNTSSTSNEEVTSNKVVESNETIKEEVKEEVSKEVKEEKITKKEENTPATNVKRARRVRRTFSSKRLEKTVKDFVLKIKNLF